jgi:hypothetical protein
VFPLTDLEVVDVEETKAFDLVLPTEEGKEKEGEETEHHMRLYAETKEEKAFWMEAIKKQIELVRPQELETST